jgi:hypothetical protein
MRHVMWKGAYLWLERAECYRVEGPGERSRLEDVMRQLREGRTCILNEKPPLRFHLPSLERSEAMQSAYRKRQKWSGSVGWTCKSGRQRFSTGYERIVNRTNADFEVPASAVERWRLRKTNSQPRHRKKRVMIAHLPYAFLVALLPRPEERLEVLHLPVNRDLRERSEMSRFERCGKAKETNVRFRPEPPLLRRLFFVPVRRSPTLLRPFGGSSGTPGIAVEEGKDWQGECRCSVW